MYVVETLLLLAVEHQTKGGADHRVRHSGAVKHVGSGDVMDPVFDQPVLINQKYITAYIMLACSTLPITKECFRK